MFEINSAVSALFVFLAGQTSAGIWWASRLTTTVRFLTESITDLKSAMREGEFTNCNVHSEKLTTLERRVTEVERRLNQ